MNICFRFKVRPFLFCYRFDLIGPCWSEVSIPSLDFYVALGENIVMPNLFLVDFFYFAFFFDNGIASHAVVF